MQITTFLIHFSGEKVVPPDNLIACGLRPFILLSHLKKLWQYSAVKKFEYHATDTIQKFPIISSKNEISITINDR